MAGEAGLLVVAWGAGQWLDVPPLERLHFSSQAVAVSIAATLPMLIGLTWTLTTGWGPARKLVALVVNQLGPVLAGRPAIELALLATLAGVAEEVLFRGVVQVGLARALPEVVAVAVASAIFGLAHFASPAYALLAGGVGFYLGALFLLQGSLLVPILTHSIYDFIALICVVRRYRSSH